MIASGSDAKSAVGKLVQISGTAEREKLGDSISIAGLSVVCLDHRFPTARLHQTVAVEGVLEIDNDLQATTGPNGEISQGTGPGTNYVIRGCKLL